MIKRILEVRIPLTLAIADCSKAASALNAENYGVLENLVTILSPFEEATKQISGEQYVSLVIPLICGLVRKFNDLKNTRETDLEQELITNCLTGIQKRLYHYETKSVNATSDNIRSTNKKTWIQDS
jgi:hypothetical protein